jgi:hypothetical protein
MSGVRDLLHISDLFNREHIELKEVMDFVRSDDVRSKGLWAGSQDGMMWAGAGGRLNEIALTQYTDHLTDFIPAKNLKITIDKEKVLSTGTVPQKHSDKIVDEIQWTLRGEGSGHNERIYKNSMMVLEILAQNNWERPVYFATTVGRENLLNLTDYFQMDGMANRFVPIKASETGGIDADKLYDNMMNKFVWGNISDPKVYFCETNLRLISLLRSNFGQLANALVAENKLDSAVLALDRAFKEIPPYQLSFNHMDIPLLEQYYKAGAKEKGSALAEAMFNAASEEMDYFLSFPRRFTNSLRSETQYREYTLFYLCDITWQHDRELFEKFRNYWNIAFPGRPLDSMFVEEEYE